MKHIGAAVIFILDVLAHVALGILFLVTFVGVQVASWTGSKS